MVYKAYENDGVRFPSDVTGAIEGQYLCRRWASRTVFHSDDPYSSFYQFTDTVAGTYWCTVHVESTRSGEFSVTVGTPYEHARWFRGGDTSTRTVSRCPDPACCRKPPAARRRPGRLRVPPPALTVRQGLGVPRNRRRPARPG